MHIIKISLLFLLIVNLLSCGGGEETTIKNQYPLVHLKPGNSIIDQVHSRAVLSTKKYAYVATRNEANSRSGIIIYPIVNLGVKQVISEFSFIDMYPEIVSLAQTETVLFAGSDINIKVLDLSNPEKPKEIMTLDVSASNGLKIVDNYLFSNNGFDGSVVIFDITNPKQPTLINTITESGYSSVFANTILYSHGFTKTTNNLGEYVFSNIKIQIIDLSNFSIPVFVNEIMLDSYAFHMDIINNHLVVLIENVTDLNSRFQIYSLADPKNPVLTDTVTFDNIIRSFGTNGKSGVILDFNEGKRFTINESGKLEILGTYNFKPIRTPDGFPYFIDVKTNYFINPGLGEIYARFF